MTHRTYDRVCGVDCRQVSTRTADCEINYDDPDDPLAEIAGLPEPVQGLTRVRLLGGDRKVDLPDHIHQSYGYPCRARCEVRGTTMVCDDPSERGR